MPNDNYANEPNNSRAEDIIQSILDNTEYDEEARSRIEYLLIELKNAIEGGGGGGSVTSYLPLTEKPKIDNHTLQAGNNTSSDLGLQTKLTFDSAPTESSTNPVTSGGVYTALAVKANSTDVYNKSAIDTVLNTKADKSTTYAKSEVDTALSSKQDTISDLTTIRSGAALGATAVQPISGKGLSTNDYTNDEKTKLAGIAEGAEVNVQSNWTQSSTTADDYIKNKPTLGTASALDVAASGNASTSQVVKGNDTRLTDARNAADVSSWAKEANKPSYNGSEIALSGYAEAQSKSSVAATDTVNTAIGKLEYRVETNENNISSILTWTKSENRLFESDTNVTTMFDVENSSVYVYTNEILKRVVITAKLKVKTNISLSHAAIAIAALPHTHYPVVSVYSLTNMFRLSKNDSNNIIAFAPMENIEIGTELKQQLEYTYF